MFQIDLKSRKSVYDQIIDNFKRLIKGGVLSPGESIPTVSELSKTLIANPNTVLKAYLELENQRYFSTDEGHEWFIAGVSDRTESDEHGEVTALYGRLHADIQALIDQGQSREDIGNLIGMGVKSFIKLEGLSKKFESVVALNELNLNIKKGSIYGLVGMNGSGKSTIIKHLAGLYYPESGESRIDGMPTYDNKHGLVIGYMPEDLYFLPGYNLKMLQKLIAGKHKKSWNQDRYEELVELFGLNEEQVLSTFSRGMQKQAGLILALSIMPDVLLLDEAIDGMDPIVRREAFKYIIEDVCDKEMTAVITSHNIRELDGICDTVGIIKDGKMLTERNLDEMRANIHKIQITFPTDFLLQNYPYDDLEVLHMEELGSTDLLVVRGNEEAISQHLKSFNPLIYDLLPMTLEEIFIYETEVDTQ